MAKTSDIIKQLYLKIPQFTNLFTEEFSVTSLTRSGTTITAITSVAHNLVTNQIINIVGAIAFTPITSITRIGKVATVITSQKHDLTFGFPGQENVLMSGVDQAEYNGSHKLLSVDSRTQFTFEVSGNPVTPATGTMFLQEVFEQGYNGRVIVTVIDPTTFTYQTSKEPFSPANGTILMRSSARISGAVAEEVAFNSYTAQQSNELWGYVIPQDRIANKDRHIENDAVALKTKGADPRQRYIQSFSFIVFVPTTNEMGAINARDLMDDLFVILLKSVVGVFFSEGLTSPDQYGVVYVGDGFQAFNTAFYAHRFDFQVSGELTQCDIVQPSPGVPFECISIEYEDELTQSGNIIMTSEINLP